MGLAGISAPHSKGAAREIAGQREELVRRVAASSTFERAPRLTAFFLYICQCAIDGRPEAVTETQIAIHVYGRSPDYNPNEDNVVRSQARLLRMKLELHFAKEGKHEPIVILIPKGRYLPVFESRSDHLTTEDLAQPAPEAKPRRVLPIRAGVAVLFVILVALLGYVLFNSRSAVPPYSQGPAPSLAHPARTEAGQLPGSQRVMLPAAAEVHIAAGHMGAPFVDIWGRRWDTDRYYDGGVTRSGPRHFFPPVADGRLFQSMREAVSGDMMVPQSQREFRYNIPVRPGVYELRLYFADPGRQPDVDSTEDAQNERHFQVNLNGHPLLEEFDPIADAGSSAVDVRVFKDVSSSDGLIHLEFLSMWGKGAFVSAVELTPGTPGKLRPIRISAQTSNLVDAAGTRWSGDNYFIEGRTAGFGGPKAGANIPAPYTLERIGNFSYAIPVAPGSYTVRLHFMESFFSPTIPIAFCHGAGCRVFDVSCNGSMLLQDFDINQAAGGPFRPVVREFRGLHPNGQGKLLLSFSPRVNYAEVRAIEVIDEAK